MQEAPRDRKSADDAGPSATIATVERAADVLLYFSETPADDRGVTEVAADLGLSKAAVHRILTSLRVRELIHLDPQTRRYSLGIGVLRLGNSYLARMDVRRMAHPYLDEVSRMTGETATLSVRAGDYRVYVDQVTPNREVMMAVSIGNPYPLHAGGSSKALLAFLPLNEIDEHLARGLPSLTGQTITDPDSLRTELAQVRRQGWAHSNQERKEGAASVTAPILDANGHPIAVMSVCGPFERFNENMDVCLQALLSATSELSHRSGWTGV